MKIKRSLVFLITVLLVVNLTACVRTIPGSQEVTPTIEEQAQILTPGPTDVMNQIYLFATQTAMATMGLTTGIPPAEETPAAPLTTETLTISPEATEPEPYPAATQSPAAPPLATAIDVPPPTPGLPTTYTLKGGEFPYCIARRFNVDPGELLNINGLSASSVYYSGMTLRIPQSGQRFPGSRSLRPHPATYTVRAGDTVYKIACAFGSVDPEAIALANGLTPPYKLSPGQVINIP